MNRRTNSLQRPQPSSSRIYPHASQRVIAIPRRIVAKSLSGVDARLATFGLKRKNTTADGNCLFHAVSFLLRAKGIATVDHAKLRQDVCNFIESNINLFEIDIIAEYGSIAAFLSIVRKPGKYACSIVLSALSFLFNVNFCVHFPTQIYQTYPGDGRLDLHIVFNRQAQQKDGHWEATEPLL